ncbi:MAG: DUF86 domain-containing protein [Anaerolineae bacterium]|nr:DUF86 domain-containing protein [Anaerolineae bacterium]
MVNPAKLEGLARTLREYIIHLQNLGHLGKDAVLSDPYKRGAARYYLQIAIECCIDIGNHIIASEQFRPPTTHRETFQILHEVRLIPGDLALTLQQMASMRNRLVHLYSEVNDEIVFEAILKAPADCEQFVQLIINYMQATDQGSTPLVNGTT